VNSPRAALAVVVPAVVLGLALGLGAAWVSREVRSSDTGPWAAYEIDIIGQKRPAFAHAGLDGKLRRAADFDGKPLLVNFWATWCRPCVREMPMLQEFSEDRGGEVRVVGIALDGPARVGSFVENLGIEYPILIGGTEVWKTQRRFGNPDDFVPYTVLVDAAGRIRWRHLGTVDQRMLEQALEQLR